MEAKTIREYYLSRENMLKTIRYRGYGVPEKYILRDIDEFIQRFSLNDNDSVEQLKSAMSGITFTGITDKIVVYWYSDRRLGVGIREIVNDMENNAVKKALVVADDGMTPGCQDILKNLKLTKQIIIDVWTLKESMIFAPEHALVPKHRVCTLQEKKALYKSYGLKNKSELPHIKSDDVQVKYLGASKGQLIEITRKSDTNPKLDIITYRIVV